MDSGNEKESPASNSVLITGATSSLAQAIATRVLSAPGSRVMLTSRSSTQLHALESAGAYHLPNIDLTRDDDLQKLADSANSYFADQFHVVHAAGRWFTQRPFADIPFEESKELIYSNYLTACGLAHYIVPSLIERGGGHFVTFGCDSVNHHYPWMAPYTASKSALQSLAISLANEYANKGLISNVIVLCTLFTERDCELKPFGDHSHWLKPFDVAIEVCNLLCDRVGLLNGNAIKLFRYSDSYFHQSYFERIRGK